MILMRTLLTAAVVAATITPDLALAAPAGAPSWFFDPNHQAANSEGIRVAFDFRVLPFPVFVCPTDTEVTAAEARLCPRCQKPMHAATHTIAVAVRRAGHRKTPSARPAEGWHLARITRLSGNDAASAVWRKSGDRYVGYIALAPGSNEIRALIEHPADGRRTEVSVPYWIEAPSLTSQQP